MAYTIAHLSDPHISRKYYREHIKSFKMLLRSILTAGADHVVVTGDITSTADEDDYLLAREIFHTLGLLRSDRLTVVPGNHDIFGGPHRAVDVLSFPDHIRSVDYQRRLQLFQNVFAETFEGVRPLGDSSMFPFTKQVGPFSLIGMNSIPPWSFRSNPLGTNGALGDEQFEALSALASVPVDPGSRRVGILHHHFSDLSADDAVSNGMWRRVESSTMRMRKRRKLLRLMRNAEVQVVLHGHIHRNELYEHEGIRFANGAGAVCDDPVRFLKYNILTEAPDGTSLSTRTLPIPYQTSTLDIGLHRLRKPLVMPVVFPRATV